MRKRPRKNPGPLHSSYSYLENISIHAALRQQRQIIISYFFEIHNSASLRRIQKFILKKNGAR